jgi:hypothetical protein
MMFSRFGEDAMMPRLSLRERRRVVVFDLGGVLLQWNPRFLYRKLFTGDGGLRTLWPAVRLPIFAAAVRLRVGSG